MKNENQGPIQKDDPRITSYVLGERAELTSRECDEIRTLLDSDPELRAEAEGLNALAGELQAEMAAEPTVELSQAQREAIAEAASPPALSFMPRLVGGGLVAASIAFGAFQLHQWTSPKSKDGTDLALRSEVVAQAEPSQREQAYKATAGAAGESSPVSLDGFGDSDRDELQSALSALGYVGNDDLNEIINGLEDMAALGIDNGSPETAGQNAAGNPGSSFGFDVPVAPLGGPHVRVSL